MTIRQAISAVLLPAPPPAPRAATPVPADPARTDELHPMVMVGLGVVAGFLVGRVLNR